MTIARYKGYKIRIVQDDFPYDSPRKEYDHIGKLCLFHKRYDFPNESSYNPNNYNNWNEFISDIEKHNKLCCLLTIRMYDHSGIGLTADTIEKSRYPYTCPWDSGQVGFIYALKSDVYKEYRKKRISPKLNNKIQHRLIQEVKEFSQWANGEIYCFSILDEDGEIIDSCGGFYGYDHEASGLKEYAMEMIDSLVSDDDNNCDDDYSEEDD